MQDGTSFKLRMGGFAAVMFSSGVIAAKSFSISDRLADISLLAGIGFVFHDDIAKAWQGAKTLVTRRQQDISTSDGPSRGHRLWKKIFRSSDPE